MKTTDNLWAAFAGESQANRKYLAFAQKAEADGYPQIARLFRAVAEAETVHALAHLRALGAVRDTVDNLSAAMSGERYEFKDMYPEFVKIAEEEKAPRATINSFSNAMAVEKVHHGLYEEALESLHEGQDLPSANVWVCSVCGMTVRGDAPDKCPVCGAPQARFVEIK